MLTIDQVKQIQDEILHCSRPVFLFDDDPDGLSAFLLLYRYVREGVGIVVKAKPILEPIFAKKANDYSADKVFVLDMPDLTDEFIELCKAPIIWLDHHPMKEARGTKYFNPRQNTSNNYPTSYLAYQVTQDDVWIAMLGCVADWVIIPSLRDKFCAKYPDLLDKNITSPGEIIHNTPLGKLIRIFWFNLKGRTSEVKKAIKILTRIESPYELLNGESSRARLLLKKFNSVKTEYDKLMKKIEKNVTKDPILLYKYTSDELSLTTDVANELIYRHPDKIIIIAREKSGFMRCSLRSSKIALPPILTKALNGLEGTGGGHDNACGANIKLEDFDLCVKRIREQLEDLK